MRGAPIGADRQHLDASAVRPCACAGQQLLGRLARLDLHRIRVEAADLHPQPVDIVP
jgi:hypothetical protein